MRMTPCLTLRRVACGVRVRTGEKKPDSIRVSYTTHVLAVALWGVRMPSSKKVLRDCHFYDRWTNDPSRLLFSIDCTESVVCAAEGDSAGEGVVASVRMIGLSLSEGRRC